MKKTDEKHAVDYFKLIFSKARFRDYIRKGTTFAGRTESYRHTPEIVEQDRKRVDELSKKFNDLYNRTSIVHNNSLGYYILKGKNLAGIVKNCYYPA